MLSVLDKIKDQIKNSSQSFDDEFYLGEDEKQRIRFLQDFEDAIEVIWHDEYEESIDSPCLKYYGLSCPLCDDNDVRTRSVFAWTVYNYDAEQKQIFKYPANKFSPVSSLVQMYESYGTLLDRDYTITRTGTGFDTDYQSVPMDKAEFDPDGDIDAEPWSKKEMFEKFKAIHNVESYVSSDDRDEPEKVADLDIEDDDEFDVPF